MTVISKLFIEIGANASGVTSVLNGVDQSVGRLSTNLRNAGAGLTAGITTPLIGVGAAAISASTALNEGLADVQSLGIASERINELKSDVQTLAVDVGKSTTDLTGGLYNVVSAFGDSADTAKLLEINAKAATAGIATTTDAINLTSAVTKGYGDVSADAAQRASDLAFTTVKLGQTTFPELAKSIGKVVPLANELGIAQEELFATFATGTGVTGNASEVATQFRGILQSALAPTADMVGLLDELGFATGNAAIEQLGLTGFIEAVTGAAAASGTPLQKYIGSIEGQTLALALAGPQADVFTEKLAAMTDAAGATDDAFLAQTQGINAAGFSMRQLRVRAEVLLQKLGDGLAPALGKVLELLTPFADKLIALADGFLNLSPEMQTFGLGIAGVAAAAGPVLLALSGIATVVGALISPLGLAAAALGALFAFDVGGLKSGLMGIFEEIKSADFTFEWTDSVKKISLGDLFSFVSDSGGTKIKVSDFFDFSTSPTITKLSLGNFFDFVSDEGGTKASWANVFDFSKTPTITKLTLGKFFSFVSDEGGMKASWANVFNFSTSPTITKLTLGKFFDFVSDEGGAKASWVNVFNFSTSPTITKLTVGDFVAFTGAEGTKITWGDIFTFDNTTGVVKTKLSVSDFLDFVDESGTFSVDTLFTYDPANVGKVSISDVLPFIDSDDAIIDLSEYLTFDTASFAPIEASDLFGFDLKIGWGGVVDFSAKPSGFQKVTIADLFSFVSSKDGTKIDVMGMFEFDSTKVGKVGLSDVFPFLTDETGNFDLAGLFTLDTQAIAKIKVGDILPWLPEGGKLAMTDLFSFDAESVGKISLQTIFPFMTGDDGKYDIAGIFTFDAAKMGTVSLSNIFPFLTSDESIFDLSDHFKFDAATSLQIDLSSLFPFLSDETTKFNLGELFSFDAEAMGEIDVGDLIPAWLKDWTWPEIPATPAEWVTTLTAWVWPAMIAEPSWVTSLVSWIWPEFVTEPAWVKALRAWIWPAFITSPVWVTALLEWSWPTISKPAWLDSLLNWSWPTFTAPSLPGWLGGSNQGSSTGSAPAGNVQASSFTPSPATEAQPVSAAGFGMGGNVNVTVNATVANDIDVHSMAQQIAGTIRRQGAFA